ncbi:MAG: sigma-70 family RNA polymerase sigma factor [Acidobacteriota bacterium]
MNLNVSTFRGATPGERGAFPALAAGGCPKVYNRAKIVPGGDLANENTWIGKIAQGDLEAFEELYASYKRRIFAYLFRTLSSREKAEEALNEVMLSVWKGAPRFRGDSRLSTWVFGIARHKALNHLGRQGLPIEESDKALEAADEKEGMEERLIRKDLVKRALGHLSPQHREVVELTFFAELSYQEIAGVVGCPVNTVKTRMFHAKRHLRGILQEMS